MHFCQIQRLHHGHRLFLSSTLIPVVKESIFLVLFWIPGFAYTFYKFKCHKHINFVCAKAHADWGGWFYRSLVRSKLENITIVYGAIQKSYVKLLNLMQNASSLFEHPLQISENAEANEPTNIVSNTDNPAVSPVIGLFMMAVFYH